MTVLQSMKHFLNLKKLYNKGSGAKNIYASYSKDYNERIKKIYNPKVKFLKKNNKKKKMCFRYRFGRWSFFKSFRDYRYKSYWLRDK